MRGQRDGANHRWNSRLVETRRAASARRERPPQTTYAAAYAIVEVAAIGDAACRVSTKMLVGGNATRLADKLRRPLDCREGTTSVVLLIAAIELGFSPRGIRGCNLARVILFRCSRRL